MKFAKLRFGLYIGKTKKFLPKDYDVEIIKPEESNYEHFRELVISPLSKYVLVRYDAEHEILVDKWELK